MTVAVFPEDLDRARALLAEWPAQDAILDHSDSDVDPAQADTPESEPAASSSPAAATDWFTLTLIALLVGVLGFLGAWFLVLR